jgi:hypothetical protein
MIDDDCDPLPVGYIYLPSAFDLLRKRKHDHPWWEQKVPGIEKADFSESSWTKRFDAEWAEDVNELREAFAVGALTALRYDRRQRRDVQIDSDYWLSASDDAFVFRTVRNPFDQLRTTCPYLSKADFEYWLAKSYPEDGSSLGKSPAAKRKASKNDRLESPTPSKKYNRWKWTLFRAATRNESR